MVIMLLAIMLIHSVYSIEQLQLGNFTRSTHANSYSFYSIQLSEAQNGTMDRSVRIKCVGSEVINIFAALDNKEPVLEDHDFSAGWLGGKNLIIGPDILEKGSPITIYFSVSCLNSCIYSLEIGLSNIIPIEKNSSSYLTIKQESIILLFKSIPIFEWTLFSISESNMTVRFLKLTTTNLDFEENDYISLPIRDFFVRGFSHKSNQSLAEEYTYMIKLYLNLDETSNNPFESTQIFFMLNFNSEQQQALDQISVEYVMLEPSASKCFDLKVSKENFEPDETLILYVSIFSGYVKFEIYSGFLGVATTSILKKKVMKSNIYKLTFKDLLFNSDNWGKNTIMCVNSEDSASNLMIRSVRYRHANDIANLNEAMLIEGIPLKILVSPNNIGVYLLPEVHKVDARVNINLSSRNTEGSPKLYIDLCIPTCQSDYSQGNLDFKSLISARAGFMSQTQSIELDKSMLKCTSKVNCVLKVMIVCIEDIECHGELSYINDNHHLMLLENTVSPFEIEQSKYHYFKFVITNYWLESISVTIGNLKGQLKFVVYREQASTTRIEHDLLNQLNYNNIESMSFQRSQEVDLSGTYFVVAYAETRSSYSLVFNTFQSESINLQAIDVNETRKDIVTSTLLFRVYTHSIELPNLQYMNVYLTPVMGEFEIFAYSPESNVQYNKLENSFEGYVWSNYDSSASQNHLIIKSNNNLYLPLGEYKIVVRCKQIEGGSYYIGLGYKGFEFPININIPIASILPFRSIQSFISISSVNQVVRLNVFSGLIKIKIREKGSNLTLFEKLCYEFCQFPFIHSDYDSQYDQIIDLEDIESSTLARTMFQLSVATWGQAQLLINQGLIIMNSVDNEDIYIAYLPPGKEIMTSISFKNLILDVDAKLLKYPKLLSSRALATLQGSSKLEIRKNSKETILYVSSIDMNDCSTYCTLVVRIKRKTVSFDNEPRQAEYSISLSNQVELLPIDKHVYSLLSDSNYRYYRLNLRSRDSKPIENIVILLSYSQNLVDLFINWGNNVPTAESHDYRSNYTLSSNQVIPISADKLNKLSVEGVFTISVRTLTYSKFCLSVSTEIREAYQFPIQDDFSGFCSKDNSKYCYFKYLIEDFEQYKANQITLSIYLKSLYGRPKGVAQVLAGDNFQTESTEALSSNQLYYDENDYIIVTLDEKDLIPNSSIILISIAVGCVDNCMVKVLTAIQPSKLSVQIDEFSDRLFYLKYASTLTLFHYHVNSSATEFQMKELIGKINITYENTNALCEELKQADIIANDQVKFAVKFEDLNGEGPHLLGLSSVNSSLSPFLLITTVLHKYWYNLHPGTSNFLIPPQLRSSMSKTTFQAYLDFKDFMSVSIQVGFLSNKNCSIFAYGDFQELNQDNLELTDISKHESIFSFNSNDNFQGIAYTVVNRMSNTQERTVLKLLIEYNIGVDCSSNNSLYISITPNILDQSNIVQLNIGQVQYSQFDTNESRNLEYFEILPSILQSSVIILVRSCSGIINYKLCDTSILNCELSNVLGVQFKSMNIMNSNTIQLTIRAPSILIPIYLVVISSDSQMSKGNEASVNSYSILALRSEEFEADISPKFEPQTTMQNNLITFQQAHGYSSAFFEYYILVTSNVNLLHDVKSFCMIDLNSIEANENSYLRKIKPSFVGANDDSITYELDHTLMIGSYSLLIVAIGENGEMYSYNPILIPGTLNILLICIIVIIVILGFAGVCYCGLRVSKALSISRRFGKLRPEKYEVNNELKSMESEVAVPSTRFSNKEVDITKSIDIYEQS